MPQIQPIRRAVRWVRVRLRIQAALEWATTFAVVGLLLAMVATLFAKLLWIEEGVAFRVVLSGFALIPAGFLLGLFRPQPGLKAAKLIDTTHGLKDRLSSAWDFAQKTERTPLEDLSIKESLAYVEGIKARKAAPLTLPRDLSGALALSLIFVLLTLVNFPSQTPPPTQNIPTLVPLVVDEFSLKREKARAEEMLEEAKAEGDKRMEELAKKLLALWSAVERGEITQEEALKRLAALEKELADAEARKDALEAAAKELADELAKNQKTKNLAEALRAGDLEKAAEEMEKLAEAMTQMSEKDREKLRKTLEKLAELTEEMAKERELEREDEEKTPEELAEEERRRELDKCSRDDLTPEEKAECEGKFSEEEIEERKRELEREARQLEQLRREQKEKEEERRALEELARELRKAAEEMEKNMTPEQKEAMRQAAKKAAEQMKKLGRQQKSAARLSKSKVKIADAKDVIIRGGDGKTGQGGAQKFRERAKGQSGQDGQNGPNGQNGQNGQSAQSGQDGQGQGKGKQPGQGNVYVESENGDTLLIDPSRPGQGNASIELPGMGEQGSGQGDQPGGKGTEPGGESYGDGRDPTPLGEQSGLADANFKEVKVEGVQGKGPSAVEVIERVAQQGLVGMKYQQVYKQATKEAEDTLERAKIPLGYKRFVKRYFDLIQPQ